MKRKNYYQVHKNKFARKLPKRKPNLLEIAISLLKTNAMMQIEVIKATPYTKSTFQVVCNPMVYDVEVISHKDAISLGKPKTMQIIEVVTNLHNQIAELLRNKKKYKHLKRQEL